MKKCCIAVFHAYAPTGLRLLTCLSYASALAGVEAPETDLHGELADGLDRCCMVLTTVGLHTLLELNWLVMSFSRASTLLVRFEGPPETRLAMHREDQPSRADPLLDLSRSAPP